MKKKMREIRMTFTMLGNEWYRALMDIWRPLFLLNILSGRNTFMSLTILNMPRSTLVMAIEKMDNITMKKSS